MNSTCEVPAFRVVVGLLLLCNRNLQTKSRIGVADDGSESFVIWKLWSKYLAVDYSEERLKPNTEEI